MKIGIVLVTYNRLEQLKTALREFEQQRHAPAYMVVVDNASTDGTAQFLSQWADQPGAFPKTVIAKPENTGGSGGFYTGLEAAMAMDADWIWVSDDDAYPEDTALQYASDFLQANADQDISAICGAVINQGQIDLDHRRRVYPRRLSLVEEAMPLACYSQESFAIDEFSYVGSILSKQKLAQVGLTKKEYFLWFDDTEHSIRLSRAGKVLCIPAIRIHHDTGPASGQISWKTYYGIRNRADMFRCHFPKIYFLYFCGRRVLDSYLADIRGKNKNANKLTRAAIGDAFFRRFGLHPIYKPGWKPQDPTQK